MEAARPGDQVGERVRDLIARYVWELRAGCLFEGVLGAKKKPGTWQETEGKGRAEGESSAPSSLKL